MGNFSPTQTLWAVIESHSGSANFWNGVEMYEQMIKPTKDVFCLAQLIDFTLFTSVPDLELSNWLISISQIARLGLKKIKPHNLTHCDSLQPFFERAFCVINLILGGIKRIIVNIIKTLRG